MPLQNHIHLDTLLSDAPENAPVMKWKINVHGITPFVIMNLRRTRQGRLHRNILLDNTGNEMRLFVWNYTIKLTGAARFTDLDALKLLNGANAYLCDSLHANDGEDHSADIHPVVVQIGKIETQASNDPTMQFFLVEVQLEDNSI